MEHEGGREGGRERGREKDPEAQLNADTLTPAEVASMERVRLSGRRKKGNAFINVHNGAM